MCTPPLFACNNRALQAAAEDLVADDAGAAADLGAADPDASGSGAVGAGDAAAGGNGDDSAGSSAGGDDDEYDSDPEHVWRREVQETFLRCIKQRFDVVSDCASYCMGGLFVTNTI